MKAKDIKKNQLMNFHFQKLMNLDMGACFIFKSWLKNCIEDDTEILTDSIWVLCEDEKEVKVIDNLTTLNGYDYNHNGSWEEDVLEINIDIIIRSINMSPKNGDKSILALFKATETK